MIGDSKSCNTYALCYTLIGWWKWASMEQTSWAKFIRSKLLIKTIQTGCISVYEMLETATTVISKQRMSPTYLHQ